MLLFIKTQTPQWDFQEPCQTLRHPSHFLNRLRKNVIIYQEDSLLGGASDISANDHGRMSIFRRPVKRGAFTPFRLRKPEDQYLPKGQVLKVYSLDLLAY
jgi:hypothetical protein